MNPLFFQDVEGFANVGAYRLGEPFRVPLVELGGAAAPLYMSNPRFWNANATYANKVTLSEAPNEDECGTTVDIEPHTGNGTARRVLAHGNTRSRWERTGATAHVWSAAAWDSHAKPSPNPGQLLPHVRPLRDLPPSGRRGRVLPLPLQHGLGASERRAGQGIAALPRNGRLRHGRRAARTREGSPADGGTVGLGERAPQNWTNTVGRFLSLELAVFITCLCVGIVGFLALLVAFRRQGAKKNYEAIN